MEWRSIRKKRCVGRTRAGRTSDGSPTTSIGWKSAIELVAWPKPNVAPRCAALSSAYAITLTLRGDEAFPVRTP